VHNLRVRRLEVSVYHVYITNQFHTNCVGGGGGDPLVEVTVNTKGGKLLRFLVQ
jgi:hypothetical protein